MSDNKAFFGEIIKDDIHTYAVFGIVGKFKLNEIVVCRTLRIGKYENKQSLIIQIESTIDSTFGFGVLGVHVRKITDKSRIRSLEILYGKPN